MVWKSKIKWWWKLTKGFAWEFFETFGDKIKKLIDFELSQEWIYRFEINWFYFKKTPRTVLWVHGGIRGSLGRLKYYLLKI
jgi:hypothetical protein